ncbi:MAG: cbb3-type cytochrome oxidase assembly protein CcoS [SAR324 cluster bacterium]|nr:cbb3-type cytochrome oxidase assembly protein CcoS [SAR324 cluster bacterium]
MDMLPVMIFVSLFLGGLGLVGVLWGLKNGQFDDPEGSRYRVLFDDEEEDRYQENLKKQQEKE